MINSARQVFNIVQIMTSAWNKIVTSVLQRGAPAAAQAISLEFLVKDVTIMCDCNF